MVSPHTYDLLRTWRTDIQMMLLTLRWFCLFSSLHNYVKQIHVDSVLCEGTLDQDQFIIIMKTQILIIGYIRKSFHWILNYLSFRSKTWRTYICSSKFKVQYLQGLEKELPKFMSFHDNCKPWNFTITRAPFTVQVSLLTISCNQELPLTDTGYYNHCTIKSKY